MLKKILSVLAVLLTLGYIAFAAWEYSDEDSSVRCKRVVVVVKDSVEHRFVRAAEIKNILKRERLNIVGRKLKDIDYSAIEAAAESHTLVSRAESFSTPSGIVYVNIWQFVPVIRMMSEFGDYYLNKEGKKTGLSPYSAADVLVANGYVKSDWTIKKLFQMSLYLQKDPFWDAQIEQIYVEPNGEWVLIPRVGEYEILFGLPVRLEDKLNRLRKFYTVGLSKVGWDRYSKINLKFEDQIVCTKKEQ